MYYEVHGEGRPTLLLHGAYMTVELMHPLLSELARTRQVIVLGDTDGIRLQHAVELFELRGGGVMGDLVDMPTSQLAVLPGTVAPDPARVRAPRPRRVADRDDPAVPRRADAVVSAQARQADEAPATS